MYRKVVFWVHFFMFLLFINDITDIFGDNLTVKLYADVVKMYSVIDHDGKAAFSGKWKLMLKNVLYWQLVDLAIPAICTI